jgi:HK97 gp10 family phage protein
MSGETVTVTIPGLEQLEGRLDRVLAALTGKTLEAAGIVGALKIVNAAKRNAPVVTGTLRRSIHVGGHTALSGELQGKAQDLGRGELSGAKANIRIGSKLEYAPRIEYGFTGTDSLGRRYNQPPEPFLRPAWDEHRAEAIKATAQALRDLVVNELKAGL